MPPARQPKKLAGAFCSMDANTCRNKLHEKGYSIFEWTDAPGAYYSPHSHGEDEFIVVLSGSIVFKIDGVDYRLEAGDALDLPAETVHAAVVDGKKQAKYFICS